MINQSKQDLSYRKVVFLIAAVATILAIFGALYFYKAEYKSAHEELKALLESVTKLKYNQVKIWLEERRGDVKVFGNSPFFTMGVKRYIENPNDAMLQNDVFHRMSTFVETYDYEDMIMVDKYGNRMLSVSRKHDTLDKITIQLAQTAINEKKILFSDFYYCDIYDTIHYDIITPLYDRQGEAFAAFILRINPQSTLYPMIEEWPIPNKTAETFLCRLEGDSVRYLTKLRKIPNERLSFSLPVTSTELPAVKGAMGYKGHFAGIDYSGTPVLSYIIQIPGTPWIMLTKMDQSEAFSNLKERAILIIVFTVMLLALVIGGIAYGYRSRQRNIYREMYEKEKNYQSNLKEKEQLLRETQSIAKIGGWEFDAVTLLGKWTEETARIHDLEPDDPTNVEIGLSFYVNGSRQLIEKAVDDAIKYGTPYDLELEMITAKGKQKWVRTIAHPEVVDGKVVKIRGSLQDITDIKRVQLDLMESREELEITLNSIGDGVISTDRNGIITGINPVAASLIGYSKEEATGMLFDEVFRIIDATTREEIESPVDRVLKSGEVIDLSNHTLLLSRDGREINISDSAAPIMDIDNDIRGVVIVFSDVTQAYEARQRLRESEQKYRLLFENMVTGFALHEIILDNEGNPIDYKFLEVNPGFENLTGLKSENITGKSVREIIPMWSNSGLKHTVK